MKIRMFYLRVDVWLEDVRGRDMFSFFLCLNDFIDRNVWFLICWEIFIFCLNYSINENWL